MEVIDARVLSREELLPELFFIWLEAPTIAREARPGQFLMVSCGVHKDPLLRRPLCVSRLAPMGNGQTPDRLALLFSVRGRGSLSLGQCQTGDCLSILGPLGKPFRLERASRKVVLVAGGTGLSPLGGLAEEAVRQGKEVTLLLGVESATKMFPPRVIPQGVRLEVASMDGSMGHKGLVTELLAAHLAGADQCFAVGPLGMYKTLARIRPSLPPVPIQISLETRMACGTGLCFACSVPTRQGLRLSCKDGPVFALDEVLWDRL
ncbi:MAG: dihydroorotate dehydrogenase electron transfer subunit [Chloroflexi bacterium]|nr:dihydroorotate dehydrogenase electron transfer subunit [Chloroflexota bacterium]